MKTKDFLFAITLLTTSYLPAQQHNYGCSDHTPIKGVEVDPEDGFKAISNEVDLIPYHADRLMSPN